MEAAVALGSKISAVAGVNRPICGLRFMRTSWRSAVIVVKDVMIE